MHETDVQLTEQMKKMSKLSVRQELQVKELSEDVSEAKKMLDRRELELKTVSAELERKNNDHVK